MRDLIIKKDWLPGIERAPEEVKQQLFYRIVKYGCLEQEVEDLPSDADWGLVNAWERAKADIDRMKTAQEQSIEYGKNNGKKNHADPILIWEYCQKHPNCKVGDIGEALHLPQTNASKGPYSYIYENEGWKNRKNSNWNSNLEEKNSRIGMEKIPELEGILEEKELENGKNSGKVAFLF
jgi:hypothetical protein